MKQYLKRELEASFEKKPPGNSRKRRAIEEELATFVDRSARKLVTKVYERKRNALTKERKVLVKQLTGLEDESEFMIGCCIHTALKELGLEEDNE